MRFNWFIIATGLVGTAHSYFCSRSLQSEKSAFFVADLGAIMRQHVRWRTHMPQIRPYYAVRCNSSPAVIEVLAALGSGFTCSNKVMLTPYRSFAVLSVQHDGREVFHFSRASRCLYFFFLCCNTGLFLNSSLNLSSCRAMGFPPKTSSTAASANKSPT